MGIPNSDSFADARGMAGDSTSARYHVHSRHPCFDHVWPPAAPFELGLDRFLSCAVAGAFVGLGESPVFADSCCASWNPHSLRSQHIRKSHAFHGRNGESCQQVASFRIMAL